MNGYLKVLLHIFIVSNEDEILLSFRKFILITLDLWRHKKCASRSKYPATGWEGGASLGGKSLLGTIPLGMALKGGRTLPNLNSYAHKSVICDRLYFLCAPFQYPLRMFTSD